MLNAVINPLASSSGSIARQVHYWACALFLFAMPFTSIIAIRNIALGIALIATITLAFRERAEWPRMPYSVGATILIWALVASASWLWSIDRIYTANELRPEIL